MELIDYFNEFSHIYDEFFEIPYRVTMDRVEEEYKMVFGKLPSLMNDLYKDINSSKISGKTIMYDRDKGISNEYKAALALRRGTKDKGLNISFYKIHGDMSSDLILLMDRNSVLIFSCYCIFLYLSHCSKVGISDDYPFLELCAGKIPNIFNETCELKFGIQFRKLFGMNYFRVINCDFVYDVLEVAKEIL